MRQNTAVMRLIVLIFSILSCLSCCMAQQPDTIHMNEDGTGMVVGGVDIAELQATIKALQLNLTSTTELLTEAQKTIVNLNLVVEAQTVNTSLTTELYKTIAPVFDAPDMDGATICEYYQHDLNYAADDGLRECTFTFVAHDQNDPSIPITNFELISDPVTLPGTVSFNPETHSFEGELTITEAQGTAGQTEWFAVVRAISHVGVTTDYTVRIATIEFPVAYQSTQAPVIDYQVLYGSTASSNMNFGKDMDFSADGKTLVVGCWKNTAGPDGSITHSGAAFVWFHNPDTNNFYEHQKLTESPQVSYNWFGTEVAITGDGNTIAVAIYYEYIILFDYDVDSSLYVEGQKIIGSPYQASAFFGHNMYFATDGQTLLATAHGWDDDLGANAGAAYLLELDGAGYVHTTEFKSPNILPESKFGKRASLAGNGDVAVMCEDETIERCYVYRRDALGVMQETSTGTVYPPNGETGKKFGFSVDLSWSAEVLIVSSYIAEKVNIYYSNGFNEFVYDSAIYAADSAADDHFGWSTRISHDGLSIVTGAPDQSSINIGVWYVHHRADTDTPFSQHGAAYTPTPSNSYMTCGQEVAISGDGRLVAAGAPGANVPGSGSGAAYLQPLVY